MKWGRFENSPENYSVRWWTCAGGPAQDQRTSQFWLERWTSGAATSASPAAPYWAIGAGGRRWSTPAHDQRRATGRFAPVSGAGRPALVDQRTAPKIVSLKQFCKGYKVKQDASLKPKCYDVFNTRCNHINKQEEMKISIDAQQKETQHTKIKHMHELWVCASISSRQVST